MSRRDILRCEHEPFSEPYYYGPERLAERWMHDDAYRKKTGLDKTTYLDIFDRINKSNTEGKRIFIKDMAQYFLPPNDKPTSLAPSLLAEKKPPNHRKSSAAYIDTPNLPLVSQKSNGDVNEEDTEMESRPYTTPKEKGNPTIVPNALLSQFHFAFLIRHPKHSIPSYYRCCIPPLQEMTGFDYFRPDEAGYSELRRLFDYLRSVDHIGPGIAGAEKSSKEGEDGRPVGTQTGKSKNVDICLVDADDLLDKPQEIIEAFCESVGIDYSAKMLEWDEESQEHAIKVFASWKGFHEDAIHSNELKPRAHVSGCAVGACELESLWKH